MSGHPPGPPTDPEPPGSTAARVPPPPEGEPAPAEDGGAHEGLFETAVSVLASPRVVMRRLAKEPHVGWALAVVTVLSALSSVAAAAQVGGLAAPDGWAGAVAALLVIAGILGAIAAVVALVIWAGILHATALLLGGSGEFRGLFAGLGFAYIPSAFTIPAQLLPVALGTAGSAFAALLSVAASVWMIVLGVIAIQENHGFSTGRAVAALLLPFAALVVLAAAAVVTLAVLTAALS